ncbi:unnamed protein product [Eruca vesicaria subsp. sativa]|uniref:Uncharacterized protein n=1 Tax=Eruca vesicaria subsp. sativa TaxID=29727 RepID=A0ABC8K7U5_ERUVS|nr:unnamed protein product [Eruca vesicaria subsp. sativa]
MFESRGELIIWKLHVPSETNQSWKVHKSLSYHRKDVLDLQWSPDDAFLISGSVDNSCIIWDVNKGVALSKYVASLSSDVNKPQAKSKSGEKMNYVCQHVITKVDQQRGDDLLSFQVLTNRL